MGSTAAPLLRLSHPALKNLSESSVLRSFDLIIHAHSVYLYFLEYRPPIIAPNFLSSLILASTFSSSLVSLTLAATRLSDY